MIHSFADELVKIGSKGKSLRALAERLKRSPLAEPVGRAAGLGAGVSAVQEAIGSEDPSLIRAALSGAAGGALTGRLFPGWFTRHNTASALRAARKARK